VTDPNPIIIPTVGRVVWFYPASNTAESGFVRNESGGPYAAIIARVWNDKMVNLTVFDANGAPHSRTSVTLVQGDDAAPDSAFCGWMPFQKGQAARQDAHAKEPAVLPRITTHRQELEHSAAHALASRVAEVGHSGGKLGKEVRESLDALLGGGEAKPAPQIVALPVRELFAAAGMSAVTEIDLAAQAVAPRVTPADIEAAIASEDYFTAAQGLLGVQWDAVPRKTIIDTAPAALRMVTLCVLVLRNGTKIVGVNTGPVSPENFDADIGRKYAREHAIEQVWPLLGYELRSKLAAA